MKHKRRANTGHCSSPAADITRIILALPALRFELSMSPYQYNISGQQLRALTCMHAWVLSQGCRGERYVYTHSAARSCPFRSAPRTGPEPSWLMQTCCLMHQINDITSQLEQMRLSSMHPAFKSEMVGSTHVTTRSCWDFLSIGSQD